MKQAILVLLASIYWKGASCRSMDLLPDNWVTTHLTLHFILYCPPLLYKNGILLLMLSITES